MPATQHIRSTDDLSTAYAQMREALPAIARALEGLNQEERARVIAAAAILVDCDALVVSKLRATMR